MDEKRFERAIREYWKVRTAQAERQRETGKADAGASRLELPGYYRAEKKWDLVVVHEDQPLLA